MTTQHFVDKTLEERADERDATARNRTMTKVAGALVNFGLVVSALLTIAYLTLLTQEAAGLADPWGYILGLLVGLVAIIPAELGLVIWRERLAGERQITGSQRLTAVVAMLLAGVFSALTTSSFFSYSLPQLFPASYLAIAPTLNVGAIVGAWIVFIMAVVFYSISSRETQQNLASAAAFQAMFDARVSVLRSSAEAVRAGSEATVTAMEQSGIFDRDVKRLIIGSLGYDDQALAMLPSANVQPDTAVPGPTPAIAHQPEANPKRPSIGFSLVDLGYTDHDQPDQVQPDQVQPDQAQPDRGEKIQYYPASEAPEGGPATLTFGDHEWKMMWVGNDGLAYSRTAHLPSDPSKAWAAASSQLPPGMNYEKFVQLHRRHNDHQRDKLAGNFTQGGK